MRPRRMCWLVKRLSLSQMALRNNRLPSYCPACSFDRVRKIKNCKGLEEGQKRVSLSRPYSPAVGDLVFKQWRSKLWRNWLNKWWRRWTRRPRRHGGWRWDGFDQRLERVHKVAVCGNQALHNPGKQVFLSVHLSI